MYVCVCEITLYKLRIRSKINSQLVKCQVDYVYNQATNQLAASITHIYSENSVLQ